MIDAAAAAADATTFGVPITTVVLPIVPKRVRGAGRPATPRVRPRGIG
jgi:hypothetical protein